MRDEASSISFLLSKDLEKRLRHCHKRKLPFMDFDDVLQEYRITILEGRAQHQTLDQFCIDLYRKVRKFLKDAELLEDDCPVTFKSSRVHDVMVRLKNLSGYDRIIVFMICVYGVTCAEMAIMLDISEGRVSQVVNELVERINAKNS